MSAWLVESLIGSSLLMLVVLVLRRPVARLWGPQFAYALWALPLVRMILPPLPGWQSVYQPVAAARPDGGYAVAIMPGADAALYTQPLPAADNGSVLGLVSDWPMLLLILWAVGAGVWLAAQWTRHARFVGQAVREGTPLTTVGGVDVIMSTHVPGPMAAGIWRRRILLPADFLARYSAAERRMTLLHEGAHHDRGDLLANLGGLVVLAAHWWNPLAHFAWRAFRADQELACDATVLAGSDGNARAAYAGAVLKSACVATPVAACAMTHKSQLKERIAMMKDRKFAAPQRVIGGLLLAGMAGAALAATASGQQPAPPVPPAPPATPAAPAAPEAPKAQRMMIITKNPEGKGNGPDKADTAGKTVVRTIIMQDGKRLTDSEAQGAADADLMLFGADGKPGNVDVQVTTTEDGRKRVMVRRIDTARLAGEAAETAQAQIAAVRADLRARCEQEGIRLPADADLPQLASCGMELQKRQREAMVSARAAIETTPGLSPEQRARALKGIDAAMASNGQDIMLFKK